MRKTLALMLAILLFLNLNAFAESLPVFDSLLDARDYLNEQVLACPDEISFRLSDPDQYTGSTFAARARSIGGQYSADTRLDGDVVTIEYTYYPGMRIYRAIQTGDASDLTADERTAAQIAAQVAAQAAEKSDDPFDRILYLHDWMCENITYEAMPEARPTMPRVCGAVGALVDGRANCQGYADTFRLLGLLSGLTVRKQEGMDSDGGAHDWNAVLLNGEWFIVDVTMDDPADIQSWCYAYMIAGRDICNYGWLRDAEAAEISAYTDSELWYYSRNDRLFENVDALARAAYFARRDDKIKLFRGAVDDSDLTWHDLSDAILSVAMERGKKCSWGVDCFNRGAYTYYTVRWTKW